MLVSFPSLLSNLFCLYEDHIAHCFISSHFPILFSLRFLCVCVILLFVISIKHCNICFHLCICLQCSSIMHFPFAFTVFVHYVCSLEFLRFRLSCFLRVLWLCCIAIHSMCLRPFFLSAIFLLNASTFHT